MFAKIAIGIAITAVLTITLLALKVEFGVWGWVGLSIWEFLTIELAIILFDQVRPGRPPRVPPPEEYGQLITAIVNAKHYFAATSSKPVELWEQPTFLRHVDLNTLKTISEYSSRLGLPAAVISSSPADKQELWTELNDIINRTKERASVPYFYGIRYLIYPEKTYEKRRPFVDALLQKHLTYRMHCIPLTLERLQDKLHDKKSNLNELADSIKRPGRFTRARYEIFGRPFRIPDFLLIDDKLLIWFEGKKFRQEDDQAIISLAKKVLIDLAVCTPGAIWGGFAYEQISHVARAVPEAAAGFFSHDYFERWLKYLEKDKGPLYHWIMWENEQLAKYIKPTDRLLDVGCGYGRHLELVLSSCGHASGVDNSIYMIRRACTKLSNLYPADRWGIFPYDASNLLFSDNTFNVVICMTNTFGNMNADKVRNINEMARVLKRGGTLLISVYNDTPKTLGLRTQSYTAHEVGLLVTKTERNRIIYTREGLVSEQFSKDEFNRFCKGTKLKITKFEDYQDVGFLVVFNKE